MAEKVKEKLTEAKDKVKDDTDKVTNTTKKVCFLLLLAPVHKIEDLKKVVQAGIMNTEEKMIL
jgi:hypothetical protein